MNGLSVRRANWRGTPSRSTGTAAAWRALVVAGSARYHAAGRFAFYFARGKLGRDPMFHALIERGDLPPGARVLDLGCGQGLLAALLSAADALRARGGWPAAWPTAPAGSRYTGIELLPREVARARAAFGTQPGAPRFVCADLRGAALPASDAIVLLDVLHYLEPAQQERLLERVRDALAPGGRLLLRVGDAARGRRHALGQWIDRQVARWRGRPAATFGRPLADWLALLASLGFTVQQTVAMSRGTPFVNVLLVAHRSPASRGAAAGPRASASHDENRPAAPPVERPA